MAGGMRHKLKDITPIEAAWGHPNYKDIVRSQRTFLEALPYPVVTYSDVYDTWLFFRESYDSPPFFCSCQRRPMLNFLKMNEQVQSYRLCPGDSLLCHFIPRGILPHMPLLNTPSDLEKSNLFREQICHRCLLKVPSVRWSNNQTHSAFLQHFGWYWKQALLSYGIDWFMPFLEDQCTKELKDLLTIDPWHARSEIFAYMNQHKLNIYAFDHAPGKYGSMRPGMHEMYELSQMMRSVCGAVEKQVEAELREHFGFPPRGKTLNYETLLYLIARSIFAPAEVLRHARPTFLNGLTLDVFIPTAGIALEYQGYQHFEPAEHFGGDEHFRLTLRRDKRKANLCKANEITVIYFDVSDKMTEDYVRDKIREQSKSKRI